MRTCFVCVRLDDGYSLSITYIQVSPLRNHQVILPYINSASGRRNFLELKSANCGLFPQYCDELLGLSNATGLSHETFLAMSLRHELVTLARPGQILPDTLECTDVLTPHLYAHTCYCGLYFLCPCRNMH